MEHSSLPANGTALREHLCRKKCAAVGSFEDLLSCIAARCSDFQAISLRRLFQAISLRRLFLRQMPKSAHVLSSHQFTGLLLRIKLPQGLTGFPQYNNLRKKFLNSNPVYVPNYGPLLAIDDTTARSI